MPVRVRALPPGIFIANHFHDVGGVDYVQSIFKAYKAHLKSAGLNGLSRESFSKYIWLANKLGLIVFDHAEPPAFWDAVVDGVRVTAAYRRESRPRAPSPRHYYRIIDPADPRWLRLETSYRESIGLEVPPPFPRVPYIPPEVAPPVAVAPPPPRLKKVRKPKAPKPTKPKPIPKQQVIAAPFEARMAKVVEAMDQLGRSPTLELADAIEEEIISIAADVVEAMEGTRGAVRERLSGINLILHQAHDHVTLLKSSVRTVARETLPARRAIAESALRAAIRVLKQDLTGI